ncbi:MAG: D-alanyl-D-alanine carboxypeptidase, partial [Octadecabacter sp.]|nr:D-alanyl-D-alanine carboxypeptidase [Octadecabacter sp.]
MTQRLTRRAIVAGLLSGAATAVFAEAPFVSQRPSARTGAVPARQSDVSATRPQARPSFEDMIAQANLGGTVGCVLADARSGEVLVNIDGNVAVPPASVTKALTALYALNALGGAHRFKTRIFAFGDVNDGILNGDLMISGGGDPTLDTDDLAELAKGLVANGLREVTGRLLCWRGALPYAEEIEPSQLDHLGYNPAVSGLNLNFNRVHFEWRRSGGAWQVTMDARTASHRPDVTMAQVRVVERSAPVFTAEGPDRWTVARRALGNGGARWMPVRQPALYTGDVFRTLCRAEGLSLPEPEVIDTAPEGGVELAVHQSDTLRVILEDMLLYSTNLTAEGCGLA